MEIRSLVLGAIGKELRERDERIKHLENELAKQKTSGKDNDIVNTNAVAIRSVIHVGRSSYGMSGRLWLDRYNGDIVFDIENMAENWDSGKLASTFLSRDCPVGKAILSRVTGGTRMSFYMTVMLEPIE